jgi:hypothetical protein
VLQGGEERQQCAIRVKRAAKNGRVRRICDSFTRWRAHVFEFAALLDCRAILDSPPKFSKQRHFPSLVNIKVTPRTLLGTLGV